MNEIHTDSNASKSRKKKGDKVEVIRILTLAVISFVLGFGLVIFFLAPSGGSDTADLPEVVAEGAEASAPAEGEAGETESAAVAAGGGYAPSGDGNPLLPAGGNDEASGGDDGDEGGVSEADAPPEVPPGRTPDGVSLDGDAFYLKCWDAAGTEISGDACDKLTVLEKRMSTRLYVVDKCRQAHSGASAKGKLSLGMEVDFEKHSLSFWNGASSTLENAAKVATCLRTELNGLPITSVDHKANRYRMFFTVLFGESSGAEPAANASATPAKKLPRGKTVQVVMDRVRVRQEPVDGAIIGKISSGNEVKLLGRKGEWCRVLTPNENEGWMICEALSK